MKEKWEWVNEEGKKIHENHARSGNNRKVKQDWGSDLAQIQ